VTAKQENRFPRIYRKAPEKEHFTADELIADLRSEMAEKNDSLDARVKLLKNK
jgi:hypothetical protein